MSVQIQPGPRYLFLGSILDTDLYMPRLILEALNTWARQWSEEITILDNESLPGLESEVESFKHLTYRRVRAWTRANMVFCFMDDLRHSRGTQEWLDQAAWAGIPVYWITGYQPKRD